MQIINLHYNIISLYVIDSKEKNISEHEKSYEQTVKKWEHLKKNKMKDKEIEKL